MKSLYQLSARVILVSLLVTLLVQGAWAHTYLSSVYLGDEALVEGDCVRPHPAVDKDSPIPLVTAPDMTCGWLPESATAANRKCPITAGSTIGIQWHHESDAPTDDIIDPSHKGPVMVYLAKSDTGLGNVWFKIYEDGYNGSAWGVDRLLANGGRVEVTIPSDIAPGNYLLRGEVLALHMAYLMNGSQPYVGCVELTVSGPGSADPAGVALPGAYSPTDPGILIDIYTSNLNSYVIPGPAVYGSGSTSSASAPSSSSSMSSSTSAGATAPPTASPTSSPTESPTAPSTAPTTKPYAKPTSDPAPTDGPAPSASSNVQVTIYESASQWWFAVTVSGVSMDSVASVEVKDSDTLSTWALMSWNTWGYSLNTQGKPLVAPLTVRVTSEVGTSVVATIPAIIPYLVIDTNGQL